MNLLKSRIFKNSVVIVLSFFVAFCLLEVTLRLFDPIGIKYFIEVRRYFASMQNNDIYAYIHTPGYNDVLQGVEVKINSHGFRGPGFDTKKANNITRILVLGDSVVFGWGVPQSDIFTFQLQHMLTSLRKNIEIIPLGVGSWNTRTEYEYFKVTGLAFEPNILIHLIVSNDIEPKRFGHTDISKEKLFEERKQNSYEMLSNFKHNVVNRSYFLSFLQYYLKQRLTINNQNKVNVSSSLWKDTELALDGIVELCQKRKIIYVPFLYGTHELINENHIMKLYSDYFEKNDIKYIYLPDEKIFAREFTNTIVDRHPNSKGHYLLAERIYNFLKPLL